MKKAFEPIVTQLSKILILGTMPGEKSLALQQYYGNRGNQFWKIMFDILRGDFTYDYDQRIKLLQENNIALWDVLRLCERRGSLDSNILNEVPNDFESFYKMYPNIKNVYFSSKNAEKYYNKYVGKREGLNYFVLPSPSGANATKSFLQKKQEWQEKILPQIK